MIVFGLLLTLGTTAVRSEADVRKFDVQGVKLGMKLAEVQKALATTDEPRQFPDGSSQIYIKRPDGWIFSADLLPEALGGGVFSVSFSQRLDNVPPEALVTAVQSKYGKPDDVKFDKISRLPEVNIVYGSDLATIRKLKFPNEFIGPRAGLTFEEDFRTLRIKALGTEIKEVLIRMYDGPSSVSYHKAMNLKNEQEASKKAQQKASTIKF